MYRNLQGWVCYWQTFKEYICILHDSLLLKKGPHKSTPISFRPLLSDRFCARLLLSSNPPPCPQFDRFLPIPIRSLPLPFASPSPIQSPGAPHGGRRGLPVVERCGGRRLLHHWPGRRHRGERPPGSRGRARRGLPLVALLGIGAFSLSLFLSLSSPTPDWFLVPP